MKEEMSRTDIGIRNTQLPNRRYHRASWKVYLKWSKTQPGAGPQLWQQGRAHTPQLDRKPGLQAQEIEAEVQQDDILSGRHTARPGLSTKRIPNAMSWKAWGTQSIFRLGSHWLWICQWQMLTGSEAGGSNCKEPTVRCYQVANNLIDWLLEIIVFSALWILGWDPFCRWNNGSQPSF